jgi:hypothetical protein
MSPTTRRMTRLPIDMSGVPMPMIHANIQSRETSVLNCYTSRPTWHTNFSSKPSHHQYAPGDRNYSLSIQIMPCGIVMPDRAMRTPACVIVVRRCTMPTIHSNILIRHGHNSKG